MFKKNLSSLLFAFSISAASAQEIATSISFQPVVTFPSETGIRYRILASESLMANSFTEVTTLDGTGGELSWTDLRQISTRLFYRVEAIEADPSAGENFTLTVTDTANGSALGITPIFDVRTGSRLSATISGDSITINGITFEAELIDERGGTREFFLRGGTLQDDTAAAVFELGASRWLFRYNSFEIHTGPFTTN